jgi:hypothetical protein
VFDLTGIFDNNVAPSSMAGSQETVRRWFVQGHSYIQSNLTPTINKVIYGDTPTDAEYTYKVNENNNGDKISFDYVFCKLYSTCTYP